jgi:hypothetical protein
VSAWCVVRCGHGPPASRPHGYGNDSSTSASACRCGKLRSSSLLVLRDWASSAAISVAPRPGPTQTGRTPCRWGCRCARSAAGWPTRAVPATGGDPVRLRRWRPAGPAPPAHPVVLPRPESRPTYRTHVRIVAHRVDNTSIPTILWITSLNILIWPGWSNATCCRRDRSGRTDCCHALPAPASTVHWLARLTEASQSGWSWLSTVETGQLPNTPEPCPLHRAVSEDMQVIHCFGL